MLKRLFTPQFTKDLILSVLFIGSIYGITHNPIVRPMPAPVSGNWSIQFMQHPLLFGFAGHNYLLLRAPDGTVATELHGLATDERTNEWKYIGSNKTDLLQVWEFTSTKYIAGKTFPGILLTQGSQEEMEGLWQQAKGCMEPINEKRIPYPSYGFSLKTETMNSNSVAYTLTKCMGLDTKHIGIWTPGSTKDLLK